VLMLSSDQDGEVVNAARLIGRTLQDAGSDWFAFADAITFGRAIRNDWRQMVGQCRSHPDRLTPREFDFINNIASTSREISEKQLRWLEAIFERVAA